MHIIGEILIFLLNVVFWIIIIQAVLSWLVAFEVVNVRNPQAANFIRLLDKITDPLFKPLRKVIPPIAGIDITPIIIIFAIYILKSIVASIFFY